MNRPILLCTGGESPAIILEAIRTADRPYRRAAILTSGKLLPRYQELARELADVLPVAAEAAPGLVDLATQAEHDAYMEDLCAWYLRWRREAGGAAALEVCLAGGFKSMVAGLQRVAHLFGAGALFHVLADSSPGPNGRPEFPRTRLEVEAAVAAGRVRRIALGAEAGWAAFRHLRGDEPKLRAHVDGVLSRLRHRDEGSEDDELPYPALAWLPDDLLHWLRQPLDPVADLNWLRALPKVELHTHLGGFATHGAALAEVRAAARPPAGGWPPEPPLPAGWPLPPKTVSLADYQKLGDATGSKLLGDPAALRAQARALVRALRADGVLYAEVRCSPANYARSRGAWDVLADLRQTFAEATAEAGPEGPQVHLILIGTRTQDRDLAPMAQSLSLAVAAQGTGPEACRVVGVDLAGTEDITTRPREYEAMFEAVHRCNLSVTVHAGENDGPESIYQAVHRLHARRLGHALRLGEAPHLRRTVADRAVAVELCPYANAQIVGFAPLTPDSNRTYPLRDYLDEGLRVTVNSDNLGISAATLTDNLALAGRLCRLTRLEVVALLRHAVDAAFVTPGERAALRRRHSAALLRALLSHPLTIPEPV